MGLEPTTTGRAPVEIVPSTGSDSYCLRGCRHGQLSTPRPPTAQRAPTAAQNVLPVIDEPWMRSSPCPSHTAPVTTRSAPRTRLAMVT